MWLPLLLLLPCETLALALVASAPRSNPPSIATQTTADDGANAALLRPSPTPTARFAAAELLLHGRDYTMGHDTCGFGSAQPWITYECYLEDATCMNIGQYRGCCTSGSSACQSTMWTTCEDYQSIQVCGSDDHTRCCQSGAPYCVTWHLATDETTYTVFDCDVADSMPVREMLATPLESITTTGTDSDSALATPSSSSPSSSASSSESASSPSGSATSSGGGGGGDSSSSSDSDSSEATTSQSSHTSASPAGAIAGGVVGGLVVIGLTVLGLVLLYRRRSKGNVAAREKLVASPPPPPATGPQEIASSDTTSPLYDPVHGPGNRWEVDGAPGLFEAPDTSRLPEAPYAPARGQEANRAELS
ncbi:hypothetical protein SLS62_003529 [Diatrype stigma]|uniref:Uncharacterized protein n=1 Tax=Diatrype stigma TaxID=117547 RepID=A0AAN9USC7_9PEZI